MYKNFYSRVINIIDIRFGHRFDPFQYHMYTKSTLQSVIVKQIESLCSITSYVIHMWL